MVPRVLALLMALSLAACGSEDSASAPALTPSPTPQANPTATATIPASQAYLACPVTPPNGSTPPGEQPNPDHLGNGALWTGLWPYGRVVFQSGGPGQIHQDGSLEMKFFWWRGVRGQLEISGRRLDGAAPPLGADIPTGYGDTGFQATSLIFATEGCWEVTGRAGGASLTFVTFVQKI